VGKIFMRKSPVTGNRRRENYYVASSYWSGHKGSVCQGGKRKIRGGGTWRIGVKEDDLIEGGCQG